MMTITNDTEFRQALKKLNKEQLREIGAGFVESVLHLNKNQLGGAGGALRGARISRHGGAGRSVQGG